MSKGRSCLHNKTGSKLSPLLTNNHKTFDLYIA